MRFASTPDLPIGACAGCLRLRRSLFPAKLELNDPKEPRECDEKAALLLADKEDDRPVSSDVEDKARLFENPDPLLERFRRLL